MRTLISYLWLSFICLSISLFVTSCQDKLCEDHNHTVSIVLNFAFEPASETSPTQMNIYFFPKDGSKPFMYQTSGKGNETVKLPAGTYRIVCLNTDTDQILSYNTDSWDNFYVTTPSVSSASSRADTDQTVYYQPNYLYVGRISTDMNLNEFDKTTEIKFTAQNKVLDCSLVIKKIKNFKYIREISGTITGLSAGYYPCLDKQSTTSCTYEIKGKCDLETEELQFVMLSFGRLEESHILTFNVTLVDGSVWKYVTDITEQLNKATPDESGKIAITIDGLSDPESITSGSSSFNPEID